MLPTDLLTYRHLGRSISIPYLTPRDDVWLREALHEFDSMAGLAADDFEKQIRERIVPMAANHGVSSLIVNGLSHVVKKRWKAGIDSVVVPQHARNVLFELAAQFPKEEALERGAAFLGISVSDLQRSLFADRPEAKRMTPPETPWTLGDLRDQYNLSLVQGLLLHARDVTIRLQAHARSVVRYAKLKGLIGVYEMDGKCAAATLSGPLSLFHHTIKYGRALATFFPAVVATPSWSAEANLLLRGDSLTLRLSSADPIGMTHVLPRETDSLVERHLMRDVKRLRTEWSITRESRIIRAGKRLFFPDFTLERGTVHVLVEVVGYYTSEYLREKLSVLATAEASHVIVCIDESLACEDEAIRADGILRYRKRIDARALLNLASRLVESGI